MSSFLEDYSDFIGDGTNNEDGLSLGEYLSTYDPSMYRSPSVTADVLLFRYSGEIKSVNEGLSLLMVKRRNHPCIGYWALPGGFCEIGESLEDTARRELEEETGIKGIALEQVYTWGEVWRDPRDRVITTAYIALVDDSISGAVAGDDAAEVCWYNVYMGRHTASNDKKCNTTYTLKLTGEDNGQTISAKVLVSEDAGELLKQPRYHVVDRQGIAFDHARFIVNGLLYIEDCINRRNAGF